MKKNVFSKLAAIGAVMVAATMMSATSAQAVAIDFSSDIGAGGQVLFNGTAGGTTITFGSATATAPFLGPGSVAGFNVEINEPVGGFVIGGLMAGPVGSTVRSVLGSPGSFLITDGAGNTLTGTLDLISIFQTGSAGGTNVGGQANLSLVSVTGTNPTLAQFLPGGVLATTFQFNGLGIDLNALASLANGTELTTSFSGTVTPVPEPGSMVLLGTGLFGIAHMARRRFRKA